MRKLIFPMITEEEKLPFYVESIGATDNQNHVQRQDGYPSYHFLYCTSGSGKLIIAAQEFTISAHMGFFFHPGIPHEYYPETEPWTTWWITFDGYSVKDFLTVTGLGVYTIFRISDMERLHQLHGDIHTAAASISPDRGYDASHLLYRFLLELNSCIGTETFESRHGRYQQLQPLLLYIEDHYHQSISLNEMAEITRITPQHLCRLFRKVFNMRPFEYLTKYRLQKAKEILVSPGNPTLKQVAAMTGYNDTSYFCAVFKHYEEMTPIIFKRMHKEF